MKFRNINIFIFLFAFFNSNLSFSQSLIEQDIVGIWRVMDSQIIPELQEELGITEEGKKYLEMMRKGFKNTEFIFNEDMTFQIKLPEGGPDFMQELKFMNNANWKINDEVDIVIGTVEDGFSLMGILVVNRDRKIYFILDGSEFLLQVDKI